MPSIIQTQYHKISFISFSFTTKIIKQYTLVRAKPEVSSAFSFYSFFIFSLSFYAFNNFSLKSLFNLLISACKLNVFSTYFFWLSVAKFSFSCMAAALFCMLWNAYFVTWTYPLLLTCIAVIFSSFSWINLFSLLISNSRAALLFRAFCNYGPPMFGPLLFSSCSRYLS